MFRRGLPFKHTCSLFIILLSITACTHSPPRVDNYGKPQREYTYQAPEQIDDGWQVSSLAKEGVNEEIILDLMKTIIGENYPNTHSVLLVKDGKLILEEYFYGNKRDDLHYLASATKSITSILIGISLDKDFLTDVDQNVSHWFNDYQSTKWISQPYNISVRHLLSMTSGIEWDENRSASDPKHDYFAMRRGGDWIRYVFNKELVAPPGQKFNYNGGLSALLGEIIRRTSGLDAEKFSEKYFFDPLGISHYRWLKYNDGSINTGGGLLLKPRDMAKVGQLMLNDGKYNGKQIVSEEWITESTDNYIVPKSFPMGSGYGYQWWRGETNINGQTIKTYFAQGLGGQFIFIVPSLKITAIFTSQLKDNPLGEFRPQVMMTEYIIPALLPPASLYEVITLDQSVFQDYVGEYEYKRWNIKASVTRKDKKIFILPSDLEKTELFPISETAFRGNLKGFGGIEVDFSKNDNDKIDHMTVRIGFSLLNFDKIK